MKTHYHRQAFEDNVPTTLLILDLILDCYRKNNEEHQRWSVLYTEESLHVGNKNSHNRMTTFVQSTRSVSSLHVDLRVNSHANLRVFVCTDWIPEHCTPSGASGVLSHQLRAPSNPGQDTSYLSSPGLLRSLHLQPQMVVGASKHGPPELLNPLHLV